MNSDNIKISLRLILRKNLFNLKDYHVKEIRFHLLLAKCEIRRLNEENNTVKNRILTFFGINNNNKEISRLEEFRDSFIWVLEYKNNRVLRNQEREVINNLYE